MTAPREVMTRAGHDNNAWRRDGMTVRQYAESIGVRYGTVKRWVNEGMPVLRDWSTGEEPCVSVNPEFADRWVARRYPSTVAHNRRSVVYIARRADGAIKIGFTSDTARRQRELRKESRQLVEVLCSWPGAKPDELALHARFAEYRIEGEWFNPVDELLAFVEEKRATADGGASGSDTPVREDEGVRGRSRGRRVQGRRAPKAAGI